MNEPLFDGLTAVAASLAIGAVLILRSTELPQTSNADRSKQRHIAGLALLALSVGALLYRWIDSVSAFPPSLVMGTGRQGMLTAVCGFGIASAILSVSAASVAARVKSFLAVAACGTIALVLAAAWEWALLWIVLLALGAWALMWLTSAHLHDTRSRGQDHESLELSLARRASYERVPCETQPEQGLIMLIATGLLVLLLGTWQHVVENEGQRQTRSKRYSAWPRPTALANAWERSGWVIKADGDDPQKMDRKSAELVAGVAVHEQRIAWGLGAMLLVVVGVAWRQSRLLQINDVANATKELSRGI